MITLRDKESSKKEKEYPVVFDYRKFNFSSNINVVNYLRIM